MIVLCAALTTCTLYAALYLLAWSVVWRVPEVDRDGLEWMFVAMLTLPWSLLAGVGGWAVVHAGAVLNAGLVGFLVAWSVRRRMAISDSPAPCP